MKFRKKVSLKCASTVQVKNFLTEFTLESSAFKYNERLTYYQIARGLVLGGLISLKYSRFDEFISKKFSKKVDGAVFSKPHTNTFYYESFNLPLRFPVAPPLRLQSKRR